MARSRRNANGTKTSVTIRVAASQSTRSESGTLRDIVAHLFIDYSDPDSLKAIEMVGGAGLILTVTSRVGLIEPELEIGSEIYSGLDEIQRAIHEFRRNASVHTNGVHTNGSVPLPDSNDFRSDASGH